MHFVDERDELVADVFGRPARCKVVVARIKHYNLWRVADDESLHVLDAIRELRSTEAALDQQRHLELALQLLPQSDRRAADEQNSAAFRRFDLSAAANAAKSSSQRCASADGTATSNKIDNRSRFISTNFSRRAARKIPGSLSSRYMKSSGASGPSNSTCIRRQTLAGSLRSVPPSFGSVDVHPRP